MSTLQEDDGLKPSRSCVHICSSAGADLNSAKAHFTYGNPCDPLCRRRWFSAYVGFGFSYGKALVEVV